MTAVLVNIQYQLAEHAHKPESVEAVDSCYIINETMYYTFIITMGSMQLISVDISIIMYSEDIPHLYLFPTSS